MKKVLCVVFFALLTISSAFSGGSNEADISKWPEREITVICPWAVGGVADVVNRTLATYGQEYLGVPVLATNELGAGGNVALTNYLKQGPNTYELIFGNEGCFSVTPNVAGGEAIQFTYDDFVPIINLYSAIFVMTADSTLGINDLDDLKEYGQNNRIKIAVNGVASAEAFLAMALMDNLGLEYDLVSYNGANLALDAAAKGETAFAISHQSQAAGNVEAGVLTPVVMFNEDGVDTELFKDVKGVGEYGFAEFYPNTCCLMTRKGTDPSVVEKIRNAYLEILKKPEVKDLYDELMIEINPMDAEEFKEHIDSVTAIVLSSK